MTEVIIREKGEMQMRILVIGGTRYFGIHKGMLGTIVQGYLKKGYNRATAEMMAREFFRYES